MSSIQAIGLGRTFAGRTAVADLSFTVEEGEIFGFLGPNGAGKTTTIRMLTGQLRPTSGQARVAGCDVALERDELKARIGVVFEDQNLYERLSGRDNLLFFARLYGVPTRRVDDMLEQVGLQARARERVQRYSLGMKQRLLIGRALLHRPRVLFLDEPTRGLDPIVSRDIRALVCALAQGGTSVFLTTHYMEEADQLCQRVAFIDAGRMVALDAPARLKSRCGEQRVRVGLDDGRQVDLMLSDPANGYRLGELAGTGRVLTVHSAESTLEEVFLRLTGKELAE